MRTRYLWIAFQLAIGLAVVVGASIAIGSLLRFAC